MADVFPAPQRRDGRSVEKPIGRMMLRCDGPFIAGEGFGGGQREVDQVRIGREVVVAFGRQCVEDVVQGVGRFVATPVDQRLRGVG